MGRMDGEPFSFLQYPSAGLGLRRTTLAFGHACKYFRIAEGDNARAWGCSIITLTR